MSAVFTGIDLVEIDRFKRLNPAIRKRFFNRVFTKAEIAYINDADEKAAGIFAAKEAVAKALGCGIGAVNWVDIEIGRTQEKQPVLVLHRVGEDAARALSISAWSISITHTKTTAAAVAVAIAAD